MFRNRNTSAAVQHSCPATADEAAQLRQELYRAQRSAETEAHTAHVARRRADDLREELDTLRRELDMAVPAHSRTGVIYGYGEVTQVLLDTARGAVVRVWPTTRSGARIDGAAMIELECNPDKLGADIRPGADVRVAVWSGMYRSVEELSGPEIAIEDARCAAAEAIDAAHREVRWVDWDFKRIAELLEDALTADTGWVRKQAVAAALGIAERSIRRNADEEVAA